MSDTKDDKNIAPEQETEVVDAAPEAELDEEALIAEAIRRGEEAAEKDLAADVESVRAERDELQLKLRDAQEAVEKAQSDAKDAADRLSRLQADWENFRRRTDTERARERSLATEKLVMNLLPVIDDLERAVAHAESTAENNADLKTFTEGVEATRTKMVDILAHEDVHPINPAGEAFDPLCHQAVGRVEDASVYDETVRDVYQLGYRMADKVIRPAMVTVTFGGEKRPVESGEADAETDASPEAPEDANETK